MASNHLWSLLVVAVAAALSVKAQIGRGLTLNPNDLGGSSMYGKDFYIAFLPNIGGSSYVELKLFIGTPASTDANFIVETADEVIFRGNASFDTPAVVTIPNILDYQLLSTRERNKGIHVSATGEEPIFVVCANYLDFFNYATFIAYPHQEFEVDTYEYRVISVNDDFHTLSLFLLVGAEDDTEITLIPNQNIELPSDIQDPESEIITIFKGESFQFSLHKLQTLLVFHSDDLTGSKIVSNRPLTLISGHECALVPLGTFDCEHIAVQVPPTATWGTEFLITGFAGRDSDQHVYRVVSASEENTTLAITCGNSTLFITQTIYEFPTDASNALCYVESTEPIFLTQLAVGGEIDFLGDPAIATIAPVDQYVNEVEFITLPTYDFPQNYITVTVPAEHFDPDRILLNDDPFTCNWEEIYDRAKSIVGYGCSIAIDSGLDVPTQHVVTHSNINGRLSVIVYGFNEFPQQGYAYLTGQALSLNGTAAPVITEVEGSLGMINLEVFPSTQELPKSQDSFSEVIIIPDGLRFGREYFSTAFVNENGVVSFNNPWKFSHPKLFPTDNFDIREKTWALAAFWSDIDIRKSGDVRYLSVSYKSTDKKELELLDFVSSYFSTQLGEEEEEDELDKFRGTWMVVAHWDHVHPSPHGECIEDPQLERTNNFQAIVITNTSHTYYQLIYKCGEMQWSGVDKDYAVVGYVLPGMYRNHPSSGYASIANSVSCSIGTNKRRRRKRQLGIRPLGRGRDTVKFTRIGDDPEGDEGMIQNECLTLERENGKLFRDFVPRTNEQRLAQELAGTLPICPDTESKMPEDSARFVRQLEITEANCYVSARPTPLPPGLTHTTYDIGLAQQCCYDTGSGSLITDPQGGEVYAGRMLLFHPLIDKYKENYKKFDEDYRDTCCDESILDGPHCRRYFTHRPTNDGVGYMPPILAQAFTDPHYLSFDNKRFDFQGRGQFIVTNVDRMNGDGMTETVFSLQSDIGELNWRGVTWNLELAFGQKGVSAFHLRPTGPNQFSVFQTSPAGLNPRDIDITHKLLENEPWYDPDAEAVLTKSDSSLTASFFNSGITIVANVRHWGGAVLFIDAVLKVPVGAGLKFSGIFGDLDGNPNNDFRKRDGTILNVGPFSKELLNIYQVEWAVTPVEDLFLPQVTGRRKRQNPEEFVPILFENLNFTAEQIALCERNEACLFDLAVTGQKEIAAVALEEQKNVNTTKEQLENTPPVISAGKRLRVNLGEEFTYSLTAVDPGDTISLSVMGGLANQARFEKIDDVQYNLKLNLNALTNEPLVLVANDSKGASATFIPILEICACVNGGQCTLEGVLSSNATIIMKCLCDEAFSGLLCEEDKNGCSEIECFEGVECLDIPAPGTGAECGACPSGYTGDGLKCYDVNECESGDDTLCDQVCVNTVGGYTCDCREGYHIIEGTNQCQDVNECFEGTSDCQQLCTNTIGSYECSCNTGFDLDPDGRNCTVKQPCKGNGGCSHGCVEVDEEAQCYCFLGYKLSRPGGTECIDIDECLVAGPCAHNCTNTIGSFACSCISEGYELLEDGRSCRDIDECERAALNAEDECEEDENTQCVNSEGSFECVCVPGHKRINGTCQRIVVEPPPPPRVAVPARGLDSSLVYISTALTLDSFTPAKQQLFRTVTVQVITDYCSQSPCTIVLAANGDIQELPVGGLQVEPKNIAIPTGLVGEDELGQLNITLYVQLSNGFLSRDVLALAVQGNSAAYILSGFEEVDECSDDSYVNDCVDGAVCVNTAGSFTCSCPTGYSGDGRTSGNGCPDLNECPASIDDCVDGATCMNTVGSFTCSCPPGYRGDGRASGTQCQDVNECTEGSHDCESPATCMNTVGSFSCSCPPGYTGDGTASGNGCQDTDECTDNTDDCVDGATCMNTVGSFTCSCPLGYSGDGRASGNGCPDTDECATHTDDCADGTVCMNNVGSFTCSCPSGYNGDGRASGTQCQDVDECHESADDCLSGTTCMNTAGSFVCLCPTGYEGDGRASGNGCQDIDECATDSDDCVDGTTCMNTVGSFSCSCPPGYRGDGRASGTQCQDVDECTEGSDDCVPSATCVNTAGSFMCLCPTGFNGNGRASGDGCSDTDECATGSDDCVTSATCVNTVGSFTCSCPPGYDGDGRASGNGCPDVNECVEGSDDCVDGANCVNIAGSFMCVCPTGFEGDGKSSGSGCQDTDECSDDTDDCVDGATCVNTVGSFTCSCAPGYKGDGRASGNGCQDVDECTEGSDDCVPSANCVNTDGSFSCVCPTGFDGDGRAGGSGCQDVDECIGGNHDCVPSATCVNTVGSFTCSCPPGYRGDGRASGNGCPDVDECTEGVADCVGGTTCMNTVGSFSCSCPPGYRGDGRASGNGCQDTDECATGSDDCVDGATCVNTVGSFTCSCPPGYRGDGRASGNGCQDVNECTDNTADCVPSATCMNTVGSFTCSCPPGYSGDGRASGTQCQDVNECTDGSNNCVDGATCVNTVGSFSCSCPPGYRGDGRASGNRCQDVDECTEGSDDCVPSATCMNTAGSFMCLCPTGFNGDGRASGNGCSDTDECTDDTADCVDGAACVNTVGSFTCSCPPGYKGDGRASGNGCPDIDECALDNGGCSHGCTNTAGSYQCDCAGGYELDDSGKSCVDINECLIDSHDCEQLCNNTPGSFTCGCDGGYDLRPDGKTCEGHVYFEFRGQRIPNYGEVSLALVGEQENGILCKTDNPDCCSLPNRRGEFYFPNGNSIPNEENGLGFYRGRHEQLIRLSKRSGVTSPRGTFKCSLPDVNEKWHSIYINLV